MQQALLTGLLPAALSEKVGTSPVGVQLLGENLVLFRDSQGKVHCLGDVCPHRGAPLHQGWVAEADGHSCVVCPYHGGQPGLLACFEHPASLLRRLCLLTAAAADIIIWLLSACCEP